MSLESEKIAGLEIDVFTLRNNLLRENEALKLLGEIVKAQINTVTHITQNSKYRLVIERAASTKGVDGFKVEVNGDDFDDAQNQIKALYDYAKDLTNPGISGNVEK